MNFSIDNAVFDGGFHAEHQQSKIIIQQCVSLGNGHRNWKYLGSAEPDSLTLLKPPTTPDASPDSVSGRALAR
jgi:hypothetical protein